MKNKKKYLSIDCGPSEHCGKSSHLVRERLRINTYLFVNIYAVILLFSITSCSKLIEIGPPSTELVTETVFINDETANAAAIAIYSEMANEDLTSYTLSYYLGIMGDELQSYSSSQDIMAVYTNSILSTNTFAKSIWQLGYKYIYQANAILEGTRNSTTLNPDLSSQVRGEALFFRAFWNFYLVNLYGEIPLILNTDYTENSLARRQPINLVYSQIIADLTSATDLLSSQYISGDGLTLSEDRTRVNRWVAMALLSRVYLYTKDYSKAEQISGLIIENKEIFSMKTDPNDVFLKNSSEAIWQLQPQFFTPEAQYFILFENPAPAGQFNSSIINNNLLNAFEAGDLRKEKWISIYGDYFYPYKLKVNTGFNDTEYSMILRLAEQYLIRAEARANQNNVTGAAEDLNIIRNRAGLPNTLSNEKASMLQSIIQERRLELFTEWGHRWLDLNRTDQIDEVMGTIASSKGAQWDITDKLLPIPQTERDNNPNLTQNSGY